jgi:oligoribonuclease
MHENYSKNNLIWLDLEMTGINPDRNHIIEMAMVITNQNLDIVSENFNIIINQPAENLTNMDKVVIEMHTKNGLLDLVNSSNVGVSAAEQLALDFIRQYVPDNASPMCGNSICLDRRFLFNYMPKVERYFHYRHLDVSTVKLLAQYWHANTVEEFNKPDSAHRAIDDVLQSIEELKFYRERLFVK